MKTQLLKKITLFLTLCLFGVFQMNAQTVENAFITPYSGGVALTPVAVVNGSTVQVEVGQTFDIAADIVHPTLFIERGFSVVKEGSPAGAPNFFNANNDRIDYNTTMSYAYTRSINVPGDGGTTAAGATVTIGELHTVRFNGKRFDPDETNTAGEWGTAIDVTIELVAPATLSVAENTLEGVSIYPNPASGLVNVSTLNGGNISVYSILGARVLNENTTSKNHQLNVSSLKSGIYLLRVVSDNKSLTKKLIIN